MPSPILYFSFDDKSGPIPSPSMTLDAFLNSSALDLLGVLDAKETTKGKAKLEGKPAAMQRKMEELEGRTFRVTHVSGDDELKIFLQ